MNLRVKSGFIFPILAVVALGCQSQEPKAAASAQDTGEAGVSVPVGKKINGATAVNSPTSTIPPGGIVLQPKDPNDAHFQPDPKLSGGH